jgi:hypothetical protein
VTEKPAPFVFEPTGETKRFAPATERNRDVIVRVLKDTLPAKGTILEIASGTGEHIVHFASAFPWLSWQPSDYDAAGLASIAAWSAESGLANILPAVKIDASANDWPINAADAIICINMIHIAPWVATEGLFAGAERLLGSGATLYLYGPYREAQVSTAESNEAFDASLKSRNLQWGLRHLDDVKALAAQHGITLDRRIEMPANNLSLVFRKT